MGVTRTGYIVHSDADLTVLVERDGELCNEGQSGSVAGIRGRFDGVWNQANLLVHGAGARQLFESSNRDLRCSRIMSNGLQTNIKTPYTRNRTDQSAQPSQTKTRPCRSRLHDMCDCRKENQRMAAPDRVQMLRGNQANLLVHGAGARQLFESSNRDLRCSRIMSNGLQTNIKTPYTRNRTDQSAQPSQTKKSSSCGASGPR